MAIGGDLSGVSHRLPPCVKNSHTNGDTEPSWHVIFVVISVLRNGFNTCDNLSIERRERHDCPPGSCVCFGLGSNHAEITLIT